MKKEWEPKTSDVFLLTGGQIKRLRDEPDPEKRKDLVGFMIHQKYHTDIGDENNKFDRDKEQKKLIPQ
jgi:hypothetical protein